MISYKDKYLNINGNEYELDYLIYDICEYSDQVVVLFHPDEGLNISRQFANLVCYSLCGRKKWTAKFPSEDEIHVYTKITSKQPLCVNSMASYQCEINLFTGEVEKAIYNK